MLKEDFLESYFQYKLEEALIKAALPSPDDRPYDNVYEAREILKELREDEVLDMNNVDAVCFKAVVTFHLGLNYFESEETSKAKTELKLALGLFSRLPFSRALPFMNYLQETFNIIGLLELNADNNEEGFAFLTKAEKLYEKIAEILKEKKI